MVSPWWCSIEEQMEQVFLFVCMCPSSVASLLQNKIGFSFAMPKMKLDLCVCRPPTKSSFFFLCCLFRSVLRHWHWVFRPRGIVMVSLPHTPSSADNNHLIGVRRCGSDVRLSARSKWSTAICRTTVSNIYMRQMALLIKNFGETSNERQRAVFTNLPPYLLPIWFCRTAAASRTTHTQIFAMRWVFVITSFFVGNFHSCIHKTYDGGDCWS